MLKPLLNISPIIMLLPVIAKILSKQLAAMARLGIFLAVPKRFSSKSIIHGTTTAGLTLPTINLKKK